jgi:hypothetical protein
MIIKIDYHNKDVKKWVCPACTYLNVPDKETAMAIKFALADGKTLIV